MDTHLEVVVIPVSDVDRAKAFYSMLGWRLDADVSGDEYRLVQFTPPGSACSILSNQKPAGSPRPPGCRQAQQPGQIKRPRLPSASSERTPTKQGARAQTAPEPV
jgi:catechol 2,3-dioxygenase-like lactoylglutathione lyase family enzyme